MASDPKSKRFLSAMVWMTVGIIVLAIIKIPSGGKESEAAAPSGGPSDGSAQAVRANRAPSGEYLLKFGRDFNPGAAAIDDLGLSVLIAVDLSGSMRDPPAAGGQEKYVQALEALRSVEAFLEGLSAERGMEGMVLKVGIIGFSSEVRDLFPLRTMDAQGFSRLRDVLEDPKLLLPAGNTAIGSALERGAAILASSGTILKTMIVISDGENTAGIRPEKVLRAINENWNDASTEDFPVLTRGTLVSFIGFDVDAGLYDDLLSEGARLETAADRRGLEEALRSIMVADISKLEAAPSP